MADTLSLSTHLGLAFVAAFILSQGVPFWISQAYLVYIVYGIAGVVTNVLNNNSDVNKIYRITHDVAYVAGPAFAAVGVAVGIYRMKQEMAYVFLIVPILYAVDFVMRNIDSKLIETLTQVVCVAIAVLSVLQENYEGTIAGVLFLVACFLDHIKSTASAKDISIVNGILAGACIGLWYAFGGHF
jgi:hypothetical protein